MKLISICMACLGLSVSQAVGLTFTVNTDVGFGLDVIPGDGLCATSAGECSLSAALMESNAFPGQDTIAFGIGGGGGIATIVANDPLPPITDPVIIDGLTQGCAGPGPCIELLGDLADGSAGLNILAGTSTVRGLAIGLFDRGIVLGGEDNLIESNHIGLDASGTVPRGNFSGIVATPSALFSAENNLIVGNRVAANTVGIDLFQSTGTRVLSNVIGSDQAVSEDFFNSIGVRVVQATAVIGAPGNGNVISGNDFGIVVFGSLTSGNLIQSNCIGPILGCTTPFGNIIGISLSSTPRNTVGGTDPTEANVIGSNQTGIRIDGTFATENSILGNYIGTDPTATVDLGNEDSGVQDGSTFGGHFIGGLGPGEGNVVMNNGGSGLRLLSGGGNVVEGNVIASNGLDGIRVFIVSGSLTGNSGNRLTGNRISGNAALGINLGLGGVTANDAGDLDSGPNDQQNFPLLTGATSDGSTTSVSGWLDSTPNTLFDLEFFASRTCDLSAHGEGETPLGGSQVTTGVTGDVFFDVILPAGSNPGDFITATATNPEGSTSEFSACLQVGDELQVGACCLPSGACVLTTETDCAGTYQGDGVTCEPGVCGGTLGACCLASGACVLTTETDCAGTYQGDGVTCEPGVCGGTLGACCLPSDACVLTTETDCPGIYQGDGVTCEPDVCGGTPVPASSGWGVALLALCLGMLGLLLRRSRQLDG